MVQLAKYKMVKVISTVKEKEKKRKKKKINSYQDFRASDFFFVTPFWFSSPFFVVEEDFIFYKTRKNEFRILFFVNSVFNSLASSHFLFFRCLFLRNFFLLFFNMRVRKRLKNFAHFLFAT